MRHRTTVINGDRREMEQQRKVQSDQIIVRLLAMLTVKGIPSKELPQMQQIAILSRAGLQPKEIAEIVNTTPNTVRVALVGIRKEEMKRGKHLRFPRTERKDEKKQ